MACVTITIATPWPRLISSSRSTSRAALARSSAPVGFVGEQQLRLIDQRPRHRRPLPFAAGELPRTMLQPVPQPDRLEQHLRAPAGRGAIRLRLRQRGHEHIFEDRALRSK